MQSCSTLPSLEFELVVAVGGGGGGDVAVAAAGVVYSPFHGLRVFLPHPQSDEVL